MTGTTIGDPAAEAAEALAKLRATRPELAAALAKIVKVVVDEAARTPRFAKSLSAALNADGPSPTAVTPAPARAPAKATATRASSRRRALGVIDPFAVYRDTGDSGLRESLEALELEQLKDIIAEHGMDHDKLAMKWRIKDKVVGRIVDKVSARSAKGAAFRAVMD